MGRIPQCHRMVKNKTSRNVTSFLVIIFLAIEFIRRTGDGVRGGLAADSRDLHLPMWCWDVVDYTVTIASFHRADFGESGQISVSVAINFVVVWRLRTPLLLIFFSHSLFIAISRVCPVLSGIRCLCRLSSNLDGLLNRPAINKICALGTRRVSGKCGLAPGFVKSHCIKVGESRLSLAMLTVLLLGML